MRDSVHNYMEAQVLDISVPILGGSIPRPPTETGIFPLLCQRNLGQLHPKFPLLHLYPLRGAIRWRHWANYPFFPPLHAGSYFHAFVFHSFPLVLRVCLLHLHCQLPLHLQFPLQGLVGCNLQVSTCYAVLCRKVKRHGTPPKM